MAGGATCKVAHAGMLQAVDFLSGVFIYGGLQLVGSGTFVVRLRLRCGLAEPR